MKKLFIGLVFVMVCCVALTFTNSVSASSIALNVTDITNADTYHSGNKKIEFDSSISEDGKTVNVVYNSADLKIIGGGEGDTASEGRPDGYAWFGVRVTAPTVDDTKITKYKIDNGEAVEGTSYDGYFAINKDKLEQATKEAKDINYSFKITWLKDGEADEASEVITQTINVTIKVDSIKLYGKEDTEDSILWNNEIYAQVKKASEGANKPQEPQTTQPAITNDEKDTTPKTGTVDYSIYVVASIAVVLIGGAFTVKKLVK